jgi:hypothetical protein
LCKNLGSSYIAFFTDGHKIGKCDYSWSNNATMNYRSWEAGQPSDRLTKNCMTLWLAKWYDLPCTWAANYMCEYPPNYVTTTTQTTSAG